MWSCACSDLIALSYLSWVWGSSHAGGRQLSLPCAEFHQSVALGQKQSSHGWSPLMFPSLLAGHCGPTQDSPELYTTRDGNKRVKHCTLKARERTRGKSHVNTTLKQGQGLWSLTSVKTPKVRPWYAVERAQKLS